MPELKNDILPERDILGKAEATAIDPLPARFEDATPHNRFPDDLREEIALAVLSEKRKIREVAETYGLNRNTVGQIVREHFAQTADLQNIELAHELGEVTSLMLQRIRNNIEEIPLSQLVVAFGILTDKRQALAGKMAQARGTLSLKVAWQDGSGAVELTTTGRDPSPSMDAVDLSISGPGPGGPGGQDQGVE